MSSREWPPPHTALQVSFMPVLEFPLSQWASKSHVKCRGHPCEPCRFDAAPFVPSGVQLWCGALSVIVPCSYRLRTFVWSCQFPRGELFEKRTGAKAECKKSTMFSSWASGRRRKEIYRNRNSTSNLKEFDEVLDLRHSWWFKKKKKMGHWKQQDSFDNLTSHYNMWLQIKWPQWLWTRWFPQKHLMMDGLVMTQTDNRSFWESAGPSFD